MTGAHILIVDDDDRNCRLLEMLLEPEGYRTTAVASGEAALVEIATAAPDLILLDVWLSGMSGHELARMLKANPATANIPIIMVTAKADREDRIEGLKAGAEEFLTKPIDRAELWLRVRNLLRLKSLSDQLTHHSAHLEQQVQARTVDLQRFRSAMDATDDAILLSSRTTMRMIEANATACKMLGTTRAEMLELSPAHFGGGRAEDYERLYDAIIAGRADSPLDEIAIFLKDGSTLQAEVRRHAIRSGDDWVIVSVLRDITARKEAEEQLHRLAHYDSLTGLANRTLFYRTLTETLTRGGERSWGVAVLFIDLDRFKSVNDTLGHACGDELLRQFAGRLVQCVRVRDTIGRLGGDEFAVILTNEDAQAGANAIVSQIRDALRLPFDLNGHVMTSTASIGITLYPTDALDAESLIKFADTAMYRAKQAGRDTCRFFTAEMNAEVLARLDLEVALRQAIEREEFELYYQPKIDIATDRIIGFEALLRWHRPGTGLVSPAAFVPVLEETGLIGKVGSWVVDTACAQIGAWLRSGVGPMPVSVNVSARQFAEGDLESDIARALAEHGAPAELIEVELTESILMINTEQSMAMLARLRARGVEISIDDFGTGYSSLAYLRRFKIDKVKIDIAFIRDIITNADDAAIALAIIRIAHSLRLGVVAEGVETAEQLAFLREHGCDQAQGYHFGRPTSAEKAEALIRSQNAHPLARHTG